MSASGTGPSDTPKEAVPLFDKKFVGAALIIAAAYCIIVVALGAWVGKDAAGVAGVALSALAVAILRQFETLQFKKRAPEEMRVVGTPRLRLSFALLVSAAALGIQMLFTMLGAAFHLIPSLPQSSDEAFLHVFFSARFWISLLVTTALAHFAFGALAGMSSVYIPGVTYSYVGVGSLLASMGNLVPVVHQAVDAKSLDPLRDAVNPVMALWLAYVVLALYGARLGVYVRLKRESQAGAA